ncbi:hypothetical protein EV192_108401 [Actinocrispum wychmicini]|uniref:N-acetyltransferase domain-containing protein n=1 Tax=Actinocrispum wychmicini TaxID=1213861 RepID=A0A4R2J7K7_9PSEU|nr:hypothetical protein EV192_108401 [Actinocrispum wychmicini]
MARPDDTDALYKVCLETADDGGDGTELFDDPQLVGHIFAAPYPIFEPSLAFVAEDGAGVGGYIIGALDTLAFGETLEREWWPKLRARYPLDGEYGEHDRRMVDLIHNPPPPPDVAYPGHPSHLHIDIVARMQGEGLGVRFMDTMFAALRAHGSPGVHLGVWARNTRAIGFYRHLGLTELTATDDFIIFGARF